MTTRSSQLAQVRWWCQTQQVQCFFFTMKITGQPHTVETHVNSVFTGKFVVIFVKPPPLTSNKPKGSPVLHQASLINVFERPLVRLMFFFFFFFFVFFCFCFVLFCFFCFFCCFFFFFFLILSPFIYIDRFLDSKSVLGSVMGKVQFESLKFGEEYSNLSWK